MTNETTNTTPSIAKKKDCFAYNSDKDSCNALKQLYCKSEKCSFYKPRNKSGIQKFESTCH